MGIGVADKLEVQDWTPSCRVASVVEPALPVPVTPVTTGHLPINLTHSWRLYALKLGRHARLIVILDADDVVLAEIAAGLTSISSSWILPGFSKPVHRADRDIDRFVFVHGLDQFMTGDARGAPHHDPVLGAVMMLLQRQPAARLDE